MHTYEQNYFTMITIVEDECIIQNIFLLK